MQLCLHIHCMLLDSVQACAHCFHERSQGCARGVDQVSHYIVSNTHTHTHTHTHLHTCSHNQRVMDQPSVSGDSHTPLHLAASHGQLDCCRLLVTLGCDKRAALNNLYRYGQECMPFVHGLLEFHTLVHTLLVWPGKHS